MGETIEGQIPNDPQQQQQQQPQQQEITTNKQHYHKDFGLVLVNVKYCLLNSRIIHIST